MAAQQPPDRQSRPSQSAVPRQRLLGVRAARGVEPTACRQCRAQVTTVRDDRRGQQLGQTRVLIAAAAGTERPPGPRRGRRRGSRTTPTAAGGQRPHHQRGAGRQVGQAGPDQVRAAGGGPCCGPPRYPRLWTRRSRRAPWRLAPAPRGRSGRPPCRARPGGHRERCGEVSCSAAVVAPRPARLPGHSGPTSVGSGRQLVAALGAAGGRGWRGRPGCACAAGSRGSSRAGGCSAGRCACSRQNSVFIGATTSRGHRTARRHFSRARRSNRPTLRRADTAVNRSPPVGTPTELARQPL